MKATNSLLQDRRILYSAMDRKFQQKGLDFSMRLQTLQNVFVLRPSSGTSSEVCRGRRIAFKEVA